MRTTIRVLVLLLAVGVSAAGAQWVSPSGMSVTSRGPDGLGWSGRHGSAAVTVVADEIVRVRFRPGGPLERDHSWAVVARPARASAQLIRTARRASTIETATLRVTITHEPFRITFSDLKGAVIDEDDPVRHIAVSGRAWRVSKRLRDDAHIYGFGEKTGRLDKRGWQLGGCAYTMWNSDTYAYDASTIHSTRTEAPEYPSHQLLLPHLSTCVPAARVAPAIHI